MESAFLFFMIVSNFYRGQAMKTIVLAHRKTTMQTLFAKV
jgi:hypothetical protein